MRARGTRSRTVKGWATGEVGKFQGWCLCVATLYKILQSEKYTSVPGFWCFEGNHACYAKFLTTYLWFMMSWRLFEETGLHEVFLMLASNLLTETLMEMASLGGVHRLEDYFHRGYRC